MKDKVEFTTDDERYFVVQPTQQQIGEADLIYKSKYSEAVRVGMLTHAEAFRYIEIRKIWTDEDTQKATEILIEIAKLGGTLSETKDVIEGLDMVGLIETKRVELLRLNGRKNAVLDNTAESYADEKRLNYYVVQCTLDLQEKPVFTSLDNLVERGNTELAVDATRHTIQLLANDGEDFRSHWPDYQWRVKNGLLDDDLNPVEGALDKIVSEVTEQQEETKKATAKKKTKKKSKKKKTTAKK